MGLQEMVFPCPRFQSLRKTRSPDHLFSSSFRPHLLSNLSFCISFSFLSLFSSVREIAPPAYPIPSDLERVQPKAEHSSQAGEGLTWESEQEDGTRGRRSSGVAYQSQFGDFNCIQSFETRERKNKKRTQRIREPATRKQRHRQRRDETSEQIRAGRHTHTHRDGENVSIAMNHRHETLCVCVWIELWQQSECQMLNCL